MKQLLKNKRALLFGIGRRGGGAATANFLVKQGVHLTITDTKNENDLKKSIAKLANKSKIKFVLGGHSETDFKNNELIVFNPGVYIKNRWVRVAQKLGKEIENDLTLFSKTLKKNQSYIGITGTRAKTTIATYINHFIDGSVLGGNIPELPLLKIVNQKTKLFVLELSSFQLEFVNKKMKPARIAIITNAFRDHLDRYKTFRNYLDTKANIFKYQTNSSDFLILNNDNPHTTKFIGKRPKSKIYFISLFPLSPKQNGLFFEKNKIVFQEKQKTKIICELENDSSNHQKSNLITSMLAAYLVNGNWKIILSRINSLPHPRFRQEIVLNEKNLLVINDAASTSPEATIACIDRFKEDEDLILICGGTDKKLNFRGLAKEIHAKIKSKYLFLLDGNATEKLLKELFNLGYLIMKAQTFNSLGDILQSIALLPKNFKTILFSPGAASFEKFSDEFDRGQKFNNLIKEYTEQLIDENYDRDGVEQHYIKEDKILHFEILLNYLNGLLSKAVANNNSSSINKLENLRHKIYYEDFDYDITMQSLERIKKNL